MRQSKKPITALLCAVMVLLLCDYCMANSAEPPAIVLYVDQPSQVSNVNFAAEGRTFTSERRSFGGVTYYVGYDRTTYAAGRPDFSVLVTLADRSVFTVDVSSEYYGYDIVLSLDVENQTVVPGRFTQRTIMLAAIRLLMTLIIEGIIFACFGYRAKRSWICFLSVNLVTQISLSLWLVFAYKPHRRNYPLPALTGTYGLIAMEIIITLAEIFVLRRTVKEQEKSRITLFAVVANVLSFILGGAIIAHLPI